MKVEGGAGAARWALRGAGVGTGSAGLDCAGGLSFNAGRSLGWMTGVLVLASLALTSFALAGFAGSGAGAFGFSAALGAGEAGAEGMDPVPFGNPGSSTKLTMKALGAV